MKTQNSYEIVNVGKLILNGMDNAEKALLIKEIKQVEDISLIEQYNRELE